jgi:hypothetical protein
MAVVLVGIALSRRKTSPAPVVIEELTPAEAG